VEDPANRWDQHCRQFSVEAQAQGYVTERATFEPRLDDAARWAVFAITVEEGAQFHMGTLEFVGIRESDAAMLARKWRLTPPCPE
jgi:hypothetical protein